MHDIGSRYHRAIERQTKKPMLSFFDDFLIFHSSYTSECYFRDDLQPTATDAR